MTFEYNSLRKGEMRVPIQQGASGTSDTVCPSYSYNLCSVISFDTAAPFLEYKMGPAHTFWA